jgi:hypothetical protein
MRTSQPAHLKWNQLRGKSKQEQSPKEFDQGGDHDDVGMNVLISRRDEVIRDHNQHT